MTLADYEAAIRPKVYGTWDLHNQLPRELDFFLTLSSTSGIIGNASQAAYAVVFTFLDALVNYRNGLGLAAATLDLGVILDVGYVAENSPRISSARASKKPAKMSSWLLSKTPSPIHSESLNLAKRLRVLARGARRVARPSPVRCSLISATWPLSPKAAVAAGMATSNIE